MWTTTHKVCVLELLPPPTTLRKIQKGSYSDIDYRFIILGSSCESCKYLTFSDSWAPLLPPREKIPRESWPKKYIKAISFILNDFQVRAYFYTTLEILVKMSSSEKNIKPLFPFGMHTQSWVSHNKSWFICPCLSPSKLGLCPTQQHGTAMYGVSV